MSDFSDSHVLITGTSRGLGEAMALQFLKMGAKVTGMSRNSSIEHPDYTHISIDLSDPKAVSGLQLDLDTERSRWILINNSATLGNVDAFVNLQDEDIIYATQLNFIAPLLLINKFSKLTCNESCKKFVINIGTGAAKQAIDGWSMYCSTKAGILAFTSVVHLENEIEDRNLKIIDLAPGVIDTKMQEEIRSREEDQFSNVQHFRAMKENGELQSAEQTADLIIRNFDSLFSKNYYSDSIRNYT